MNSEVMPKTYANDQKTMYGAHYAILMNDISYDNPVGKFSLNYITPSIAGSTKSIPRSGGNVINDRSMSAPKVKSENFITMTVPSFYFNITKLEIVTNVVYHTCGHCGFTAHRRCAPIIIITRKDYKKGTKFIVVNIGGDINSPCIVGVLA